MREKHLMLAGFLFTARGILFERQGDIIFAPGGYYFAARGIIWKIISRKRKTIRKLIFKSRIFRNLA